MTDGSDTSARVSEVEAGGRRWAQLFPNALSTPAARPGRTDAAPPGRADAAPGRVDAAPQAAGEARPGGSPIPTYLHLLRAKDLADRAYDQPLDVAALARAAYASRAHFIRAFARAFGETPHQYLLRRRVERAKDLLRGTSLSVTGVCFRVGFHSLGSFSTAFRDLVGEPPTRYRGRWQERSADVPGCFSLMWTRPVGRAPFEKPAGGTASTVDADTTTEVQKT